MKKCPVCSTINDDQALVCRQCDCELPAGVAENGSPQAAANDSPLRIGDNEAVADLLADAIALRELEPDNLARSERVRKLLALLHQEYGPGPTLTRYITSFLDGEPSTLRQRLAGTAPGAPLRDPVTLLMLEEQDYVVLSLWLKGDGSETSITLLNDYEDIARSQVGEAGGFGLAGDDQDMIYFAFLRHPAAAEVAGLPAAVFAVGFRLYTQLLLLLGRHPDAIVDCRLGISCFHFTLGADGAIPADVAETFYSFLQDAGGPCMVTGHDVWLRLDQDMRRRFTSLDPIWTFKGEILRHILSGMGAEAPGGRSAPDQVAVAPATNPKRPSGAGWASSPPSKPDRTSAPGEIHPPRMHTEDPDARGFVQGRRIPLPRELRDSVDEATNPAVQTSDSMTLTGNEVPVIEKEPPPARRKQAADSGPHEPSIELDWNAGTPQRMKQTGNWEAAKAPSASASGSMKAVGSSSSPSMRAVLNVPPKPGTVRIAQAEPFPESESVFVRIGYRLRRFSIVLLLLAGLLLWTLLPRTVTREDAQFAIGDPADIVAMHADSHRIVAMNAICKYAVWDYETMATSLPFMYSTSTASRKAAVGGLLRILRVPLMWSTPVIRGIEYHGICRPWTPSLVIAIDGRRDPRTETLEVSGISFYHLDERNAKGLRYAGGAAPPPQRKGLLRTTHESGQVTFYFFNISSIADVCARIRCAANATSIETSVDCVSQGDVSCREE